ncbi:MAG: DUF4365 domain-containing protein, partial [Thiobacillus sp.]
MIRSKTHILEEESRIRFKQSIPENWIPRDQTPDYGYDFDVQLVNKEELTPFHFYVQLKSTDNIKKINDSFPLPFETKYFKLYFQGPFPVMICLYIKEIDKLYYIWLDDFFNNLNFEEYEKLKIQKNKTLYLNKELNKSKKDKLEHEIKRLNYSRNPDIISNDIFDVHFKLKTSSEKKKYILRGIIDYYLILHKIKYFNLFEVEEDEKSNIIVDLDNNKSIISFNDSEIALPILTENKKLTTTIAISISYLLLENGYTKKAGKLLIETLNLGLDYLDNNYLEETFLYISKILLKSKNALYIIEFSKNLRDSGKIGSASLLSNIGRLLLESDNCGDEFFYKNYIEFCESLINLFDSNQDRGMNFYNMANTLRTNLYDYKKSIKYYFKARKYFLGYQNLSYWWAELGGAFFLLNKFRLSELFYKKSLVLGEKNIQSRALMAEALLYQGKYSQAKNEIELYLKEKEIGKNNFTHFYLKWFLYDFLSTNFKDSPRKVKESQNVFNHIVKPMFSKNNKFEIAYELKKVIELDPLNSIAWYNYAV